MAAFICEQCEVAFERAKYKVGKHKHFFCSRSCHYVWKREHPKTLVHCDFCGVEFKTRPSAIKRYSKHYCSKVCHGMARRGRLDVNCDNCGQQLTLKPSTHSASNHSFCSTACYAEHKRNNPKEYPQRQTTEVCVCCGKTFKIVLSRKGRAKYCSTDCMDKYRLKKVAFACEHCGIMTSQSYGNYHRNDRHFCSNKCAIAANAGSGNPNWRGGKSLEPYGAAFNKKLKEYVRSRDGYICQECGIAESKLRYNLAVHHIDYCKTNNDPDTNLIALCISCHGKTITNRSFWTPYFQLMLQGYITEDKQLLLFPHLEVQSA